MENKLQKVVFLKDHRCFKAKDEVEFAPGVNLIVGDQGTGKSTLIDCIRQAERYKDTIKCYAKGRVQTASFNFETDNCRGKSVFDDSKDMMMQVSMLFMSHGQVTNGIVAGLPKLANTLVMLDEPDLALSIRSARKLVGLLKQAAENNAQIIAAVHHPVVIEAFNEVYSLEHRKWMTGPDFIKTQMEDTPCSTG